MTSSMPSPAASPAASPAPSPAANCPTSHSTRLPTGDAKRELRARLKAERTAMSPATRAALDARIARQVLSSSAFQQAQVLYTYLSFGDEIDTRALIQAAWQAHKQVALPRCESQGALSWYVVDTLEGLVKSPFGMEEPDPHTHARFEPEAVFATDEMLAIVPGLAFDKRGYRLGYGGGFYDRFLAQFKGTSLGLIYEERHYESLARLGVIDAHDLPVNFVATECGLYTSKLISST